MVGGGMFGGVGGGSFYAGGVLLVSLRGGGGLGGGGGGGPSTRCQPALRAFRRSAVISAWNYAMKLDGGAIRRVCGQRWQKIAEQST